MGDFRFTKMGNRLKLFGVLSEFSQIAVIFDDSESVLYIDMSEVQSINSFGVRSWVNYISNYQGRIIYKECSIPVVEQFSMIPEFIGPNSWVESFFALYFCSKCNHEENTLLTIGINFDHKRKELISPTICPYCSDEMDADFIPDEYFFFLDELIAEKGKDDFAGDSLEDLDDDSDDFLNDFSKKPSDIFTSQSKTTLTDDSPSSDENEEMKEEVDEEEEENKDDNKDTDESDDQSRTYGKYLRKPLFTKLFMPDPEFQYEGSAYTTFTENICEGGLFICTYMKFVIGDRFKVEMSIPIEDDKFNISCEVEVKWIRKENQEKNILPGVGVEFLDLSPDDKKAIKTYVYSFVADDE